MQLKTRALVIILALILLLSGCGGADQFVPPTEEPSSAPIEEEIAPSESEAVPSLEPETDPDPSFFTVNKISYCKELGAPILGEAAAQISPQEASQKITNVGDAIYYMETAGVFPGASEICRFFADLIRDDYEEVGLIHLASTEYGKNSCLLYVKEGEFYFPLDVYRFAEKSSGWVMDPEYNCAKGTDLGILCENLLASNNSSPFLRTPMDSWSTEVLTFEPFNEPVADPVENPKTNFVTARQYTDSELQAFVDADLSLREASDKISTVGDAVQYMYLRGYHFAPDNQGIDAATRYDLNSGACVGGSALFAALLNGDYDEHGYLYAFYARSEHVINYFVLDGVYYYCDFVSVFNRKNTNLEKNPVCHVTTDPSTIYKAWNEIEPNGIDDPTSDFYLGIMYITGYDGTPSMPSSWLIDSASGNHASIPLSTKEKASQQIFFVRDGYSFDF